MTLQQQWDIWLAASFAKFPSAKIRLCIHKFEEKMKIERGALFSSGIKRVPKMGGQGSFCQTSRYVCGYIPGAVNFIFDSDKNAIQKAALLAKCGDSLVNPVDFVTTKRESEEKRKARREYMLSQQEVSLGQKQRDAYARRNWSACK